jgi:hypothetical protein
MRAPLQLAVLVLAGVAASCRARPPAQRRAPAPLSAGEIARAQKFLEPIRRPEGPDGHLRTSKWTGEFADVDGDRRADCWVHYTDDTLGLNLLVWPACQGDREKPAGTFRYPRVGMAALAIPAALSAPPWLVWLAQRLRGNSAITCLGNAVADCDAPGPEWRWVLEANHRERVEPGLRGTVTPDWQTTPRGALAGALIIPTSLAATWSSTRETIAATPARAWILLDADFDRDPPRFACAGLQIVVEEGGIFAIDERQRWTWLFRGLPDYGGFVAGKSTSCVDGLVVAQSQTRSDFVVVDATSGAWLFLSSIEYEGVYHLYGAASAGALWRRHESKIEPLERLRRLVAARRRVVPTP